MRRAVRMLIRVLCCLLLTFVGLAAAVETPLEPEKAFQLVSVRLIEPGVVEARWEGILLGKGEGRNKKQAETAAAEEALQLKLWEKAGK